MPHATQEEEPLDEDGFFGRMRNGEEPDMSKLMDEANFGQGEKADDAEDYEDISEFAEEEEEEEEEEQSNHAGLVQQDHAGPTRPVGGRWDMDTDMNAEDADPFRDLWFDDEVHPGATPSLKPIVPNQGRSQSPRSARSDQSLFNEQGILEQSPPPRVSEPTEDDEDDPALREQMLLFEQARRGHEERLRHGEDVPPPPPETDAELFAIVWPQFEKDQVPRFGELLPGKRAYYVDKRPLKPPKPVQPSKVSLELLPDQEKSFRVPGTATSALTTRIASASVKGVTLTQNQDNARDSDDEDDLFESLDCRDGRNGGWHDWVTLCEAWDVLEDSSDDDVHRKKRIKLGHPQQEHSNGDHMITPKGSKYEIGNFAKPHLSLPATFEQWLSDPEKASMKLAKRVNIDMNDPFLLLDIRANEPQVKRYSPIVRDTIGGLTREMYRRYNLSNDAAYDLLKENRQSKIRGHLGEITLEHSTPALRLQYPFYKVKLSNKEARAFHRSAVNLTPGQVYFSRPSRIKYKHLKGKDTAAIFSKTKDLSMSDNSTILLLEYSEEYPVMLSNFGMNSRLVNYYRRRDAEDTSRPRYDIGETAVLQPHDKSPFAQFGFVDPGETVSAIRNALYRAPIFRHRPRNQDMVLIRTRSAADGISWYLRAVENIHVVGQEFPLVEVPGTHARQVTTVAKNRLKMVSYRIFRRRKRLRNEDILRHFPGSDIAQNRSKMREFMQYDKQRGWLPKQSDGDEVPDEETLRAMITPDTICLLDSMQVGDRQLQDAGYNADEIDIDENGEEDRDGQNLENQLAPWQITKNFLNACQSKAMLQLHGDGDPTGRGEAFNMIRTSMKGGFRGLGESVESKLDAKRAKDSSGHSYNVARQNEVYNETIRQIWNAQTKSLSSELSITDSEPTDIPPDELVARSPTRRQPSSSTIPGKTRGDDGASTFSGVSESSHMGQVLKIDRITKDASGKEHHHPEFIRDPKVIRAYVKRRRQQELDGLSLEHLARTDDPEMNKAKVGRLKAELERLERNQGRRIARAKEKKGEHRGDSSPGPSEGHPQRKTGQTVRKCANCGQVGHIKTNKKLCPLLNGTITRDEGGFGDNAFGSFDATTNAAAPTATPSLPA